jgi:hypothetical protein
MRILGCDTPPPRWAPTLGSLPDTSTAQRRCLPRPTFSTSATVLPAGTTPPRREVHGDSVGAPARPRPMPWAVGCSATGRSVHFDGWPRPTEPDWVGCTASVVDQEACGPPRPATLWSWAGCETRHCAAVLIVFQFIWFPENCSNF